MAGQGTITVDFFFDCACVWAYFAAAHLERRVAADDVTISWRPVLAADVYRQVNPVERWSMPEIKQAYYRRDAVLWADALDLPLRDDPASFGDSTSCMLACVAAGRWGRIEAFARKAMAAAFAEGRDPGDRTVLADVWRDAGLPPATLEEGLAWPDVAHELAANGSELMARGGFGVPSFTIGDAIYFGNDAVPLVAQAVNDRRRIGEL
jgi:2-hydroxychromene-2-carboxylate isomerase